MKRSIVAAFGLLAAVLVCIASAAPSVADHDIVPIAQYVQPAAAAHDLAFAVVATDWAARAEHVATAADTTCSPHFSITADRRFERCTRHGLSADALIEHEKALRFRPPDTA